MGLYRLSRSSGSPLGLMSRLPCGNTAIIPSSPTLSMRIKMSLDFMCRQGHVSQRTSTDRSDKNSPNPEMQHRQIPSSSPPNSSTLTSGSYTTTSDTISPPSASGSRKTQSGKKVDGICTHSAEIMQ